MASLEASRGITIALVSPCQWKRRQPGLTADDPAFVGRHQLIGRVHGPQVHFDLIGCTRENGRATARTEMASRVAARFALDHHRTFGKYRGGVERRAMMFAAVEAMAQADAVRRPRLKRPRFSESLRSRGLG